MKVVLFIVFTDHSEATIQCVYSVPQSDYTASLSL